MAENSDPILAVCVPKFMKFWDSVGKVCRFVDLQIQTPFPVIYIVFSSEDNGH